MACWSTPDADPPRVPSRHHERRHGGSARTGSRIRRVDALFGLGSHGDRTSAQSTAARLDALVSPDVHTGARHLVAIPRSKTSNTPLNRSYHQELPYMPRMRAFTGPDNTTWGVEVQNPGASNAVVVFRHPDGQTARLDRYAWYITRGSESQNVTGRLNKHAVL